MGELDLRDLFSAMACGAVCISSSNRKANFRPVVPRLIDRSELGCLDCCETVARAFMLPIESAFSAPITSRARAVSPGRLNEAGVLFERPTGKGLGKCR